MVEICEAAWRLGRLDKVRVAKVLAKSNQQCRYVIQFCSDKDGVSEKDLLETIGQSRNFFVKETAIIALNRRKRIEDPTKMAEVLRKAVSEIDKNGTILAMKK